tara:strand:- start:1994 stop:4180 length:2187 start_codon:yes stop_codon:yes gene_type:complete
MSKKLAKLIAVSSGSTEEVKLLEAVVRKEGTRTVDTAQFKLPASAKVNQHDKVRYIQDINDVTHLTAIYNFQGSTRDEGGFNLDGNDTYDGVIHPDATKTVNSISFDNSHDASYNEAKARSFMNYNIIYAENNYTTITHNTKFDFSKQFDIVCMASSALGGNDHSDGSKSILFSKMDSSGNGLEIGLIRKTVGFNTYWVGYARVRFNSIEREFKHEWKAGGGIEYSKVEKHRTFTLRLWREGDNKIRFSFDNEQNGSWYNGSTSLNTLELDTTNSGSSDTPTPPHTLANTQNIFIGAGRDGSNNAANKWRGLATQIKIYTGGYLNSKEMNLYQMSSPTPTTMKFSGKVTALKDSVKYKNLSCKGDGDVILNHSFNSSQFNNSTPNDSSFITRVTIDSTKKNIYAANSSTDNIMKSLILLADSEFSVVVGSGYDSHNLSGKYVAEGGFLPNVRAVLNGLSNASFWSNGRKVLFLEENDGVFANIEYKSNLGEEGRGVKILEIGRSSAYLVNSVELLGRQFLKHNYSVLSSVSSGTTTTLNHTPVNLRITHDGANNVPLVQNTDYSVDYDERKVTFLGSKSNIKIEYDYEDISGSSNSYFLDSDSSSISTYGKYDRRYFIPQLTKFQDFQRLGQKLILRNKVPNDRYQVELPFLANNIRENHRVTIKNRRTVSEGQSNGVELVIKQIEWHYPVVKTIIQVGENLIDGFDLDQADSLNLSSSISSIQKTKS